MWTMKMTTTRVTVAVLALAALSCTKELGGPEPAPSPDNGSVTASTPASAPASTAAGPGATALAPARLRPAREALAGLGEAPFVQPSPAVLEAVGAAQTKLNGISAGVPGTTVRFVDCSGAAACTSRLEAKSLTGLRDLLQAVSKEQGAISFVAREQLDAYTGQTFVADVTMGGAQARPVPADENELLVNDEHPEP